MHDKSRVVNSLEDINVGCEFDNLDAWFEIGAFQFLHRAYADDMLRRVFRQRKRDICIASFGGECKLVGDLVAAR
jgi:hypothetical protein